MAGAPLRIALYSPDRALTYDGRTREREGVGGGITARLSLLEALARLGHDVTAHVNCEAPVTHQNVRYVPLDDTRTIDCDVLIAISTGGGLTFAPLRSVTANAGLRILWVQGVPKPADLEAVRADLVVVASNFLRDVCARRWRIPEHQLYVCHNGIHQEYFADVVEPWPVRDPFALAYIGPPEKGLDSCIGVLRLLRKVDPRFHLDVFGGSRLWGRDDDADRGEPGLNLKGLLGQRELARALPGYEYCLAMQAMEEGFGIAVQEAKRAGAIVLASRVGAFGELIEHGVDGFLIDQPHTTPAAQSEAAQLVLALSDDPMRRARIRRHALATPWSWDVAAREWVALVNDPGPPKLRAKAEDPGLLRDTAPSRPRVLLAGYYGHGNLGDEAILSVLINELEQAAPAGLEVVVASGNPQETTRNHGVTAIDERSIAALKSAAEQSDLIALGGGGLLHDHYGVDEHTLLTPRHWGLSYCAGFAALARIAGKPFMLAAIGAGPLESPAAQRLSRLICEQADAGTVRDPESAALLSATHAAPARLDVAADPAFLLTSASPEWTEVRLRALGLPANTPFACVALRHWDRDDATAAAWEQAVAGALDRLVDQRRLHVLFVPFEAAGDRANAGDTDAAVARRVQKLMARADATIVLSERLAPSLVQGIFTAGNLVLAMRLHGLILAANAGVPVVALRYDDKVSHTASLLGLSEFVADLPSISSAGLFDRLASALDSRERVQRLADRLAHLRTSAKKTAHVAGGLLRKERVPVPAAASEEWNQLLLQARRALDAPPARPTPGGLPRRVARAVLPAHWRRAIRDQWQRTRPSAAARLFDRYRQARISRYGADVGGVVAPGESGLISIVLPAFNGAPLIREAIDSLLAQTYTQFELIIVNDGSTDDTGAIADAYAARDPRVRVIHQQNQQLPAALSRGFDEARGEFLTWASCDNRWRPRALEQLVGCLRRHPRWDVTYANLDLIGENGQALTGSNEFESYQSPGGSAHIRLPADTSELNTRANNFIGAGFLYRSRVRYLLGPYSSHRFGVEDYDYWMRANALMVVRKADFDDAVIEYRFHSRSLTANAGALGLTAARDRLMVFDTFRRDLNLGPALWIFEDSDARALHALAQRVRQAGHLVFNGRYSLADLPPTGLPIAYVGTADAKSELPAGTLRVRISQTDSRFQVAFADPGPGLLAPDIDQLFTAIDIRVKSAAAARFEEWAASRPTLDASVIISTHRAHAGLAAAIASALVQETPRDSFEVIVVNNNPEDAALADLLRDQKQVRRIVCPVPGIAAARNAGLAAARGAIVCFLDDDAVAESGWLTAMRRAFDEHPETGVAGGPVRLQAPTPRPPAWAPGWEPYWSHFAPAVSSYTEVHRWRDYPWGANWAARREVLAAIGGFPQGYGRSGDDFSGGEELMAAAFAQRLGYRVAIVPGAAVRHEVSADRFTFDHVRHTMIARYQVAWRAQQDLLEARSSGVAQTIGRLLLHHVDPRVLSWPHVAYDVMFRKKAQLALLRTQLRSR